MDMDPPERRECVPTSFGANPSLAVPTLVILTRRIVMMSEALIEHIHW